MMIESDEELEVFSNQVEELMDKGVTPDTQEGDELKRLLKSIVGYEDIHCHKLNFHLY